ncbi:hypothetical protein PAL_GLEAN10023277 [Pteropus alecto]|uniref:Uncharacterized protein n=1 Tax=Pteropus alecto TaxID=9402 RepID=L5K0M8_PTEAL|nr:hypothetical protein PAL_GLEAN10023277 [Pteropus alecto]
MPKDLVLQPGPKKGLGPVQRPRYGCMWREPGSQTRTPIGKARQQPPFPHSPFREQFNWGYPSNCRHHHRHRSGC